MTEDKILIYFAAQQNLWCAHSLGTDEMGIGREQIDALAEAIGIVCDEIQNLHDNPEIQVHAALPAAQTLLSGAKQLPRELVQEAEEIAAASYWSVDECRLRGDYPMFTAWRGDDDAISGVFLDLKRAPRRRTNGRRRN